jgi:hypothetical protein
MSTQLTGTIAPVLEIPQQERADWDLTILDGSVAADLSADTVIFEVKDADGTSLILKSSDEASQIEITANVATIHFVGGDTSALVIGTIYWCDAWTYRGDARVEQVLTRQRFHVIETVHTADTTPPSAAPDTPLVQNNSWRRFTHTWSVTGDSDTVTLPAAMQDAVYHVNMTLDTIPTGGGVAILTVPVATKTTTQFVIQASGDLDLNTTIMVECVDS